ncbi:CBS domain-containing protein [Sporosarcina sp. Marseille-Q4063]|uniref:DUF294 nucleotidyltransferase-like domain-containing protein n=1 Tax=Sporosarcina sp. Marseille-Q4063 TaxID=2810514 RepID=UPI001BAF52F3|nr:DUF294 nucleotidyltransferase-like domain-containing protein [Sporosarcina sp. Marseille-Q4063]QUW20719.1 CBS domain-containing protein [Sporosarcina sp. Marseille-Q4063]
MLESEHRALYKRIRDQPLFKATSNDEFTALIAECELRYYQKSEKIFFFTTADDGLFLILEGSAEVFIENKKGLSVLLEVLQEGEIIGFSNIAHYLEKADRPLDKHRLELEIMEDSYCLQIPASVIKKRLVDNSVREFILRKMAIRLGNVYASLGEQVKLADEWGESEQFVRRARDLMSSPAITIHKDASVEEIANSMIEQSISSVMVVDDAKKLVGLITEKDLVQRVIASGRTSPLKARDIMTKKLFTVSQDAYYYEVLSIFYKYGVKHLPVVKDDSLVGVLTFHNLLSKRDRGSMSVLNTIEISSYENLPIVKEAIYDVLSNLIQDEISTIHTLEIITRLYDRLARHCVKLAVQSLEMHGEGLPPVPFSWYQMGSGARGEQFMVTDQDHFLVYADPKDKHERERSDKYFALLGEEIVIHLEKAGYARCAGKMMPNEAIWRGSLSDWQKRLQTWAIKATDEHILLGYNFLSFRFLYGESALNDRFKGMVQNQLKSSQTFLYYMALKEKDHPVPRFNESFFSLFRGKEQREMIDIKLHALFPLHHCLQILGVLRNIIGDKPMNLIDGLVEKKELSAEFADDIRHAYEVALSARIQMSWKKHLRGETYTTKIKFSSIRRWQRAELKTMLNIVHSLQSHLLAKL